MRICHIIGRYYINLGYSQLLLYYQEKDTLVWFWCIGACWLKVSPLWRLVWSITSFALLCPLPSLIITIHDDMTCILVSLWPAISKFSTSDVSTGDQFSVLSLNGLCEPRCTVRIMTAQEVEALEDSRSTSKQGTPVAYCFFLLEKAVSSSNSLFIWVEGNSVDHLARKCWQQVNQ